MANNPDTENHQISRIEKIKKWCSENLSIASIAKKIKWCVENPWSIAIVAFVLACFITFIFACLGAFKDDMRAYVFLYFGIFGGGLVIWGRMHTAKQLEATEKQIELTRKSNNNEVFAKAIEMMQSDKDIVSKAGGLQIISKLMRDEPEVEYIRCVDFVSSWLQTEYPFDKDINEDEYKPKAIIRQVSEIIRCNFENIDKIARNNIATKSWIYWPDLGGINFQNIPITGAYLKNASLSDCDLSQVKLLGANLSNANFRGAILKGANLTNADMSEAEDLAAEQVLSAGWYYYDGGGEPPKLPKYLLEGEKKEEIEKWLSKPHGEDPFD